MESERLTLSLSLAACLISALSSPLCACSSVHDINSPSATYFAAAPAGPLSAVGERKGSDRVNSEGASGG
jgi:hypothetical protein